MFYIRSELKCKSQENTACVFLMWTILPMEMDVTLKKLVKIGRLYRKPLTNMVSISTDFGYDGQIICDHGSIRLARCQAKLCL